MSVADSKFSPDGKMVAYLEQDSKTKLSALVVALSAQPYRRTVVASATTFSDSQEELSLEEKLLRERQRKRIKGVTEYQWAMTPAPGAAGSILIPFRGNLYTRSITILDGNLRTEKLEVVYMKGWLARAMNVSSASTVAQNPKVSPDGSLVCFHAAGELWVTSMLQATVKTPRVVQQISFDDVRLKLEATMDAIGSGPALPAGRLPPGPRPAPVSGITRGVANYLEAEELDRYDGFWWSPDSRSLCLQESDQTPVKEFTIAHTASDDPLGEDATETHRYPFAGGPNPRGRLGVVSLVGYGCSAARGAPATESLAQNTPGSSKVDEAPAHAAPVGAPAGTVVHMTTDGLTIHVVPPQSTTKWLKIAPSVADAGRAPRVDAAGGELYPVDPIAADSVQARAAGIVCQTSAAGLAYSKAPAAAAKEGVGDTDEEHAIAAVASAMSGTVLADGYIARVAWAPDGTLFVQLLNRSQTMLDLVRYRVTDGACDLVVREECSQWDIPEVPASVPGAGGSDKASSTDDQEPHGFKSTAIAGEAPYPACTDESAVVTGQCSGSPATGVKRLWINVSNSLRFVPYEAHATRGADMVVDVDGAETEGAGASGGLPDGNPETFLLWGSERSGFQHLYVYRVTNRFGADDPAAQSHAPLAIDDPERPGEVVAERGQLVRQVTHGRWNVQEVLCIDSARGNPSLPCRVYFYANARSPLEKHVYRAPVFATTAVGAVISPQPCVLGRAGEWAADDMAAAQSADPSGGDTKGANDTAGAVDRGDLDRLLAEPAADLATWGHGCALGAVEAVTGTGFGRWNTCALQPTSGHRAHDALMLLSSCSADRSQEHRIVAVSTIGQVRNAREWAMRVQRDCDPPVGAGEGGAANGGGESAGGGGGGGDGIQLVLSSEGSSSASTPTGQSPSPHSPSTMPVAVETDRTDSQLIVTEILVVGEPHRPPHKLVREVRRVSQGSSDASDSQTSESQYSGHTAAGSAADGMDSRRVSPDGDEELGEDDVTRKEGVAAISTRAARLAPRPASLKPAGGVASCSDGPHGPAAAGEEKSPGVPVPSSGAGSEGDPSAGSARKRGRFYKADGEPFDKSAGSASAGSDAKPVEDKGPAPAWQFFSCPSDDPAVTLLGAVLLPDSSKFGPGPYPTAVSVYGGPHAQLVCENAGYMQGDRVSLQLAKHGVAVVKVDNRGAGNRGTAFEGALHLRMGTVEVHDQLAALRFLAGKGLVDLDNKGRGVGVRGWSYGGYMTLMLMCKAPQIFRCGVAGAPVTSWTDYDTAYTERYQSTPQGNPAGYAEGSVLSHLKGLRGTMGMPGGKLLLIHGLIDENVVFRHSARLMRGLMAERIRYDTILLPSERHTPRNPADLAYIFSRSTEHLRDCLTKGF